MSYNVLRDAAFNSDQPEQYHLSVQLGFEGIMYALLHKPSQTYHYISPFVSTSDIAALVEVIENDELLKNKWGSSSLMLSSANYLLMPLSANQDAKAAETIFRFQFATSTTHKVVIQPIPDTEIVVVYAVASELSSLISKYFGKAEIKHHTVSYINYILKYQSVDSNKMIVNVQFQQNFIDIAITQNKRILFCNSFYNQTPEDAIYFIMNAYQNSGCKIETDVLKISGMVAEKSDTKRLLEKFFPMAQFEKVESRSLFRFPFDTIEVHNVINLLNLYHCEL